METRVCHICGDTVGRVEACGRCVVDFADRPDAEAMTSEERMAEMELIVAPIEIPVDLIHQRIEELVGRPVMSHEIATPNWPYLVQEAGNRVHPSPESIINLIPEEKRILVQTEDRG